MFYVSRKVGRKYGVIDTSDNVEEFYNPSVIEEFHNSGVSILGAEYVEKKFTITPAFVIRDKSQLAKNKLLTGTCTGYAGFDLAFEGDKVIALPLTEDFFNQVSKDARNKCFILTIPDIVTHLADNFFSVPSSFNMGFKDLVRFLIILPKSLVEIGSNALSHWSISDIKFNSEVNRVVKGKNQGYSLYSLMLSSTSLYARKLPIRVLEGNSLFCNNKEIHLTDIEWMDEFSINFNSHGQNLSIYLGDRLTKLNNFITPRCITKDFTGFKHRPKESVAKQLMNKAIIVYLSNDSRISDINMITKNNLYHKWVGDGEINVSPYIFVVSSNFYKRFENVLKRSRLNEDVTIGIIIYDTEKQRLKLQENLEFYCQHHRQYFKTYLSERDLGKYKVLELK